MPQQRPAHRPRRHREVHRLERSGWLRATVLGANDGILSTGALLLGVVGADQGRDVVVAAGIAGAIAGAASMAIGEYVSVSSQRDAELAERATEAHELRTDPVGEHAELRRIYERRGLPKDLADEVATELMDHDPLGAHLRDELGLTETLRARPLEAAASSFLSFALGALVPLVTVLVAGESVRGGVVTATTLASLVVLGVVGAAMGGADKVRGGLRVGLGGAAALAFSYLAGQLLGTTVF